MVVHSGTDDKILDSINQFGLSSVNVPHLLGGDFKHSDFIQWLDGWREIENQTESYIYTLWGFDWPAKGTGAAQTGHNTRT
jgi:hypothetical protein